MFISVVDNGTDVDVKSLDTNTDEGFLVIELDGIVVFNYDLEEEAILIPAPVDSSLSNALNSESSGNNLSEALGNAADPAPAPSRSSLESALDNSNSSGEDVNDDLSSDDETIKVGSKSSLQEALD